MIAPDVAQEARDGCTTVQTVLARRAVLAAARVGYFEGYPPATWRQRCLALLGTPWALLIMQTSGVFPHVVMYMPPEGWIAP